MKIFQKRYTWAVCMMLAASNVLTHAKNDESNTGAVPQAQNTYGLTISDEKVHHFLSKMKKAMLSNDPHKMSEIFDFTEKCVGKVNLEDPCPQEHLKEAFRWNHNGKSQYISKDEFIKNYDDIMTAEIQEVIKKAELEDVSEVGYQGLMLNHGQIWFHPDKGIHTINAPINAGSNYKSYEAEEAAMQGQKDETQEDETQEDVSRSRRLLAKITEAILSNKSPQDVAKYFDFSNDFLWNHNGKPKRLSEEEFIKNYDKIITPEIKKAIVEYEIMTLEPVGDEGHIKGSISDGQIWFHPDKGIHTINAR